MVKYRSSQLMAVFSLTLLLFVHSCTSSEPESNPELPNNLSSSIDENTLISYPADTEPLYDISLIPETTYEDPEGIYLLAKNRFDVDSEGRVYVGWGNAIHVFQPDGTYLAQIGREGSGPGEFRGRWAPLPNIHLNHMYVYDEVLFRLSVFSLETFELDRTIVLSPQNWSHVPELRDFQFDTADMFDYFPVSDSTLLVEFPVRVPPDDLTAEGEGFTQYDVPTRYYMMDSRTGYVFPGKIIELTTTATIQWAENRPIIHEGSLHSAVPFFRESLAVMSEEGHIFTASTGELSLDVFDQEGEYLRSFSHPSYNLVDIDKEIYMNSHVNPSSFYAPLIRATDFPATWPAMRSILVDDENRLWISTITEDETSFDWWILSEYGELLATFNWPGDKNQTSPRIGIRVIRNGYLYASEYLDEETGLQQIVKYRIELTER